MKKIIIISIIFLSVYSCKKDELIVQDNSTSSAIMPKETETFPIKVKFKWDGLGGSIDPNNPCVASGACGNCIGLCIYWDPSMVVSPLTPQEISEGIGIGTISFQNNNTKMRMVCSSTPDNGDGKTRLSANIIFSSQLSSQLGFNSVTILAGVYDVIYVNSPNGTVLFNIVTN